MFVASRRLRHTAPMRNRSMPFSPLSMRALVLIAAGSAAAFILLALAVAAAPLDIDLTVAQWLRPLRSGLTGVVVDALNLLGQALVWDGLLLVLAIVLWLRGLSFEAVVLLAGVIGTEAAASVAKIVVGRVRPPGIEVADLITQASYPSGHVTRAVVTAGLLAAIAWRRPEWRVPAVVAAVALVVLMGISRIVVGEHWFTDVVGAMLFGIFALALIGIVVDAVRPWLDRRFSRTRGAR
jgi:undecaprenyl-diphosphatase